MEDHITEKEGKELKKIDEINIQKHLYSIFENPENFFKSYTVNLKSSISILFAYFTITNILREIDSSEECSNKAADYFLGKCSLIEWLDILINFYQYNIFIIDYILDNHDNNILDLYNKRHINKKTMKQMMMSFSELRAKITNDRDSVAKCIPEIEEEKEQIKEDLDGFSGSHFG